MTTIKNVTEEKKKKEQTLIRFHSANKIDNYNRWGEKRRKEKKIQKNLQNKSKYKNNKCFSWVTAVRVLSLAWSHSPLHHPRMPSNTVLVSGRDAGAKWKWSRSVVSDSLWPRGLKSTRLLCPWDFPGNSTGVDCHFLLQGIFPTQGRTWVSHIVDRYFTVWATRDTNLVLLLCVLASNVHSYQN